MSNRKPRGYWTLDRCMEDAAQYSRRGEWASLSKASYLAAYRKGWLDQCCQHMVTDRKPHGYWTLERCMKSASGFDRIMEWKQKAEGAYMSARRNGWHDQCTEHMEPAYSATDANVVYIWRSGESDLYKIGITSDRLGENRVGGKNSGVDPRIVFMLKVGNAREVESELLKLGTNPSLDNSIDGYTEFRKLTDAELGQAVSISYRAALAA